MWWWWGIHSLACSEGVFYLFTICFWCQFCLSATRPSIWWTRCLSRFQLTFIVYLPLFATDLQHKRRVHAASALYDWVLIVGLFWNSVQPPYLTQTWTHMTESAVAVQQKRLVVVCLKCNWAKWLPTSWIDLTTRSAKIFVSTGRGQHVDCNFSLTAWSIDKNDSTCGGDQHSQWLWHQFNSVWPHLSPHVYDREGSCASSDTKSVVLEEILVSEGNLADLTNSTVAIILQSDYLCEKN